VAGEVCRTCSGCWVTWKPHSRIWSARSECDDVPKLSAGLLLYRVRDSIVEVLIAHPGGPFWARKDNGAWSIPKGEYTEGEDPWAAAQREFAEELGMSVPAAPRIDLGVLKQSSGKVITAFAVQSDLDVAATRSKTYP